MSSHHFLWRLKCFQLTSASLISRLVTSVVGKPADGINPFQTVAAAFPPGSMTGAPKLRSLKLLDELEGHRPRGIYSGQCLRFRWSQVFRIHELTPSTAAGIFGYVAVDGTASFSVVIRTLVVQGSELTLGAGGAITHQSDPAKEWEEVLVKTEAVVGSPVTVA